jgi:hypothetical protein
MREVDRQFERIAESLASAPAFANGVAGAIQRVGLSHFLVALGTVLLGLGAGASWGIVDPRPGYSFSAALISTYATAVVIIGIGAAVRFRESLTERSTLTVTTRALCDARQEFARLSDVVESLHQRSVQESANGRPSPGSSSPDDTSSSEEERNSVGACGNSPNHPHL